MVTLGGQRLSVYYFEVTSTELRIIFGNYTFAAFFTRLANILDMHLEVSQISLSSARIHGTGLELKHNKAGVSATASQVPEYPVPLQSGRKPREAVPVRSLPLL
jgi:ABC-type histidine transport system ATPase subunit